MTNKPSSIHLYKSEKWLRRKFVVEKLTEEEIAKQAGVNQSTINTWLRKFGLRKKRL